MLLQKCYRTALGYISQLEIAQRRDRLISLTCRASGAALERDETSSIQHPSPRNTLFPLYPAKDTAPGLQFVLCWATSTPASATIIPRYPLLFCNSPQLSRPHGFWANGFLTMAPSPIRAAHWAGEDLPENRQPGKGRFALEKKRAGVLGELWCGQRFGRVNEAQGYLFARFKKRASRLPSGAAHARWVPPDRPLPANPLLATRRKPSPQGANPAAPSRAVNCPHDTSSAKRTLFARKIKVLRVCGVKYGPAVLWVAGAASCPQGAHWGKGHQQQGLFF